MGKIQDLYSTRVWPMLPAERLQLARMILDDLNSSEKPIDISGESTEAVHIRSPRLAHPEQSKDFAKQIVELVPDAKL